MDKRRSTGNSFRGIAFTLEMERLQAEQSCEVSDTALSRSAEVESASVDITGHRSRRARMEILSAEARKTAEAHFDALLFAGQLSVLQI
jgi:hypothetical protein